MIDILLATYNGERFLAAQLDSLLAQEIHDWRLIVRDDGSNDGTLNILQNYIGAHPGRITLLNDGKGKLGVVGNFSALMGVSDGDYAMFCDQDDVWYSDKITRTLEVMQTMEVTYGKDMPLLVHADARVTDESLRVTAASFHRLQKLSPQYAPLSRLLVQNVVHGCTAMMNRALTKIAAPITPEARMHDHWVALAAAAFGHISLVDAPLLDYRQHKANVVGARRQSLRHICQTIGKMMRENISQAEAFRSALSAHLPPDAKRTIKHFTNIRSLPRCLRCATLLKGGYLRKPFYQNLPVIGYLTYRK